MRLNILNGEVEEEEEELNMQRKVHIMTKWSDRIPTCEEDLKLYHAYELACKI